MRVLVIDPFDYTLPYDKAFCRSLADIGIEVAMLGSPAAAGEWCSEVIEYVPFAFTRVTDDTYDGFLRKWNRRIGSVIRLIIAIRLVRKLRPDVIHFQWIPFGPAYRIFVALLRKMAPVILTVHDTVPFNEKATNIYRHRLWKDMLQQFDHLIVHTNSGKEHLLSEGISRPIATIPHGPLPHGKLLSRSRDKSRDANYVNYLLFGRIKPYKGVDIFIRAVGLIPLDLRRRCRFVVAGFPAMDTEPLKALSRSCQVDENVEFVERDFTDAEVATLMKMADVIVFPYRQIDVSGVLMLSLSFGRAIIASNIGGFREILEDGKSALLVSPEDPEHLAKALMQLAEDASLRNTLARNLKSLNHSSWHNIAISTQSVYNNVLATSNLAEKLKVQHQQS